MARKSERMKLYETKLSTKMTVSQLKSFIRKATKEVNKSIKKKGTGNAQLDKSINFLKKRGGTKKEKGIEKVGLHFSGKKKRDLYEQARLLKSHFQIDMYTKRGKDFLLEREEKAYGTFLKDRDVNLSKTDYRRMVEIFGMLGDSIVEKLSSVQLSNLFSYSSDRLSNDEFFDIVYGVYTENLNTKLSRSQMLKKIEKRIQEEAAAFEDEE